MALPLNLGLDLGINWMLSACWMAWQKLNHLHSVPTQTVEDVLPVELISLTILLAASSIGQIIDHLHK